MYYTKYRPQKFSEVSKPNDVVDSLVSQVKSGKVAHAYLFVGSRGTGKTTTARLLAKALNCTNIQENGDPCDECSSCIAVKNGNYPDLIEIDAASNRGIDDIRELRDRVRLAPTSGVKKVYIIDEVHMLTTEAFNALLKTLEEPPAHVIFILCTTEFHKVPETIRSRCQVYKFKRATVSQVVAKLKLICETEGADPTNYDLKGIATSSLGGFRDAETLLQQAIEGGGYVESSSSSSELVHNFTQELLAKNFEKTIEVLGDVTQQGLDIHTWVGDVVKFLRLMLLNKMGVPEISESEDLYSGKTNELAKSCTSVEVIDLLDLLMTAQNNIKSTFIPQLPIEIAVAKYCLKDGEVESVRRPSKPSLPPKPVEVDKKSVKPVVEDTKTPEVAVAEVSVQFDGEIEEVPEEIVSEVQTSTSVDLSSIETKWEEIVYGMRDINSSIQSLLKSSKILGLELNELLLEVSYAFHKERLESLKNREMVEKLIFDITGQLVRIKCKVGAPKAKPVAERESGNLTDLNVVTVGSENALDLFDGGLPLASL